MTPPGWSAVLDACDDPVAVEHGERARELVGDEDAPARGRGVVRLAAGRRVGADAAGEPHADEPVGVLGGDEHAAPVACQVARRGGQRDAAAHHARRAVDERELVGAAEADRDEPGARVGDDALRLEADGHDPPVGPGRGRRRGRRLGGRRQLVRARGAAAGEQPEEQEERGARHDAASMARGNDHAMTAGG